jgi:hypothetical protein
MSDGTLNRQVTAMQLAFDNTTTGGKVAQLNGVKQIMLRTSADVYVDFDQPASTSQSFQVLAADTSPTTIVLEMGLIDKLYALGKSGAGTLYILAVAG